MSKQQFLQKPDRLQIPEHHQPLGKTAPGAQLRDGYVLRYQPAGLYTESRFRMALKGVGRHTAKVRANKGKDVHVMIQCDAVPGIPEIRLIQPVTTLAHIDR